MTQSWPADWDERRRGKDCPMCREGRPEEVGGNVRIFAGARTDAYLQRRDVGQRGYTIVIWRGPHVADPTELSDGDATIYSREVLHVGRAIQRRYEPAKMNFLTLGNAVPHLHTHLVPRYLDDGAPGRPPRSLWEQEEHPPLDPEEFARDVAALRALLR